MKYAHYRSPDGREQRYLPFPLDARIYPGWVRVSEPKKEKKSDRTAD